MTYDPLKDLTPTQRKIVEAMAGRVSYEDLVSNLQMTEAALHLCCLQIEQEQKAEQFKTDLTQVRGLNDLGIS
jgi:hypothetical protein